MTRRNQGRQLRADAEESGAELIRGAVCELTRRNQARQGRADAEESGAEPIRGAPATCTRAPL